MPRFFFDVQDGPNWSRDEFGDDFPALEEARDHAQAILVDMARGELPDGEERCFVCEVRDASHRVAYRGVLRFHGELSRAPTSP